MNARQHLAVLLCLLASAGSTARAQQPPPLEDVRDNTALLKAFVTVNGQVIPNIHADILAREQMGQGASDGPSLRTSIRDTLINQALMAQAARAVGLDRATLAAAQIELATQAALVKMWQQREVSLHPASDEDLQAEYLRQVAGLGTVEYQLRHLLVADEGSARRLIRLIQKGTPMVDLVVAHSTDMGTRTTGGLAGWVPRGQLHASLAQAMDGLQPGAMALKPVRSPAGWHVLKLEASRPLAPPSFDAIRPQVGRVLAERMLDAQLQVLRASAKIE
ncbi:peptidylprolyl isomerase [Hydrogenophaga sp.]|uniref:peptidylprolyl isomerase n=1 Tax=Hydrogenophaga sp. TaxID=1904254 RepID=UPI003F71A4F2